ncbi:hypothetical protein ABT187_36460 [Streptomyces sp. NPDC001817]|uniref:hypothetical protein n=1 Tax=Streptomyces sp. NPDC001817 TaxID=3154398 RepID=UPI00331CDD44
MHTAAPVRFFTGSDITGAVLNVYDAHRRRPADEGHHGHRGELDQLIFTAAAAVVTECLTRQRPHLPALRFGGAAYGGTDKHRAISRKRARHRDPEFAQAMDRARTEAGHRTPHGGENPAP